MRKVKQEIELKIKLRNPNEVRKKLNALGALKIGKFKEVDVFYDVGEAGLLKSDECRRLRRTGNKAVFTYKGRKTPDKKFKIREEIEVKVSDFEKTREILKKLGHKEGVSYEKIREIFELGNVKIVIDKLPFIGYWLEIEGSKKEILAVAQKLNVDPNKGETRHYGELFWAYCQKHGLSLMKNMTFKKEKRVKK
jgi:adenylate cyclase class 2